MRLLASVVNAENFPLSRELEVHAGGLHAQSQACPCAGPSGALGNPQIPESRDVAQFVGYSPIMDKVLGSIPGTA